ncbi:hypothetical protein EAI93_02395 [[Ruminococcus] torques]|uniref:Uncharacterized protein n=1 Tax=[Ruminococcus] torques TaxID=33039 RepID=A0A4Q5CAU3_9FIRM|nr:hypothetical protein EAI93_02395 [[Ruminococcus] torques]
MCLADTKRASQAKLRLEKPHKIKVFCTYLRIYLLLLLLQQKQETLILSHFFQQNVGIIKK